MMQGKSFSYPLTIQETYLDTFGHVNNATYLVLLEQARWDLLNKNGYGLKKIRETGLGPTVLEVKLAFLKELRLHDEVIIESQMLSYDRKVGKLQQNILRNGEICSTAQFVIGLFDTKERRLVLPTPEWLHAIGISA